jgi:hypothetical protein
VSILAKKATAFATDMARLLAQGTLLGSSPPDGTAAAPPPPAIHGQRVVLKQCYKSAISANETREK